MNETKIAKLSAPYISDFCRELSAALVAGMSVNDAIYMLMDDDHDPVLNLMYDETDNGKSLTSAVKATNAFPSYVVEMIEIGEKTGRLDAVLRELSVYYNRQEEIAANIRNAVTFPLVLLAILLVIVIVLLTQVLPVFGEVFRQIGVSMSPAASAMMNIGNAITTYSALIVGIFVVIAAVLVLLYKLPATHEKVAAIIRGKRVNQMMSSTRFATAMTLTLSSGMDIDESLEMAEKLCDSAIAPKIRNCRELIRGGKSFDKAVCEIGLFDRVNSRHLSVSFRTGEIASAMGNISDTYKKRLDDSINEKISRVEPALVAIMSILVGFVLFSVMLPMLSVITTV